MSSPEPTRIPPPFRLQWSIASLLGLTTLAALLMGLSTHSAAAAIALAVPCVPAWLATTAVVTWRRQAGRPMSWGEQARTFLKAAGGLALAGFLVVFFAGFAAFSAMLLALETSATALGRTAAGVAGFAALVVVAGAAVPTFVFACRLVAGALWHGPRSRLDAHDPPQDEIAAEVGRE